MMRCMPAVGWPFVMHVAAGEHVVDLDHELHVLEWEGRKPEFDESVLTFGFLPDTGRCHGVCIETIDGAVVDSPLPFDVDLQVEGGDAVGEKPLP